VEQPDEFNDCWCAFFIRYLIACHHSLVGKKDFWTVQCTRCPAALDKLNALASSMESSGDPTTTSCSSVVQFITVCCGKELDAARETLDGPRGDDGRRWNHLAHYFMDYDTKETAKQLLGFRQVPFYVVVDERGEIVYADGAFDAATFLPEPPPATTTTTTNKMAATCHSPTNVLVIDDLDF
jgi:hypothetical protein